jgi:hypothetical protein
MTTRIAILTLTFTLAFSHASGAAASDQTRPSTPARPKPLTPEQAARRTNETCTVEFKVETVVRVQDITEWGVQKPLEVLLVDARNGDQHTTPTERAGIIVRIPDSAREHFNARNLDELARRFEGKTVTVTGKVQVEPHPLRHDGQGNNQPRGRITVTDPAQIRIEGKP